ncbi:MAG: FAD:protein FMN transferase [Acidobacteria bacterium]|nr:FAD:protein FMN transferase [Acidobacteriota bacterium]
MLDEIKQAYYLMGTIVEIILYLDSSTLSTALIIEKVLAEFNRIEKIFSYFDPTSELYRLNLQANNQPIKVSQELFNVISLAIKYSSLSKNTFSIMLSPLMKSWHRAEKTNKLPSPKTIKNKQKLTNSNLLKLNSVTQTIFFQKKGMSLDLSGFVKGYAVDCVKNMLVKIGVFSGLINAGNSSIVTWGENPNSNYWPLAINHLQNNSIIAILNLTNTAISTSGTNEKFFIIENLRFSNLLNPQTSYPLTGLVSATVLSKSALEAEVISKMLLFLGQEETLDCCEKNDLAVDSLLIQKLDENNNTHLSYTENLPIIF